MKNIQSKFDKMDHPNPNQSNDSSKSEIEKEKIEEKLEELNLDVDVDVDDLSCNFKAKESKTQIEPIYATRPNKLLLPVLNWGPNNQLRGFRESAILAIQLNRTLCIPPFFRHHSVSSKDDLVEAIEPDYRINVEKVKHLISTCNEDDIGKLKNKSLPIYYLIKPEYVNHVPMQSSQLVTFVQATPKTEILDI